jgi:hypothetical protein
VPGRYALHDLLREYAAELAHDEDAGAERRDATARVSWTTTSSPATPATGC